MAPSISADQLQQAPRDPSAQRDATTYCIVRPVCTAASCRSAGGRSYWRAQRTLHLEVEQDRPRVRAFKASLYVGQFVALSVAGVGLLATTSYHAGFLR